MRKKNIAILTVLLALFIVNTLPAQDVDDNIGDKEIVIDFKDAPLITVLDYLSETAGLVILSTNDLSGRVSITSKQPLTVDEIIELLNSILNESDYAAIRLGKTLKIVQLSEAKQMNIPVRSGNDSASIPVTDQLVTQIIPIRYAEAEKLVEDLKALVPESAEFTSNEASNTLILTDTSANIKKIVEIVKALDTQMANVAEVKVYHLIYSDAENTAELINEIFDEDDNTNADSALSRMRSFMGRGGRGGSPRTEEKSNGSSNSATKVVASADEVTNSVVVRGPSDTLEVVGKIIKELDSNPDEERTLYVYPLQNAQAANVKEVLNNLFSELENMNSNNTRGSSGNGGARRGNARTQQAANNNSNDADDISDDTYLEADEDTNMLIIMTSNKNYKKLKPIIEELDKPVPQVLIKVLIAEITVTDGFDIGTNFSSLNATLLPDTFISSNLTVTLRAMEESGKLNVLSRPYILTSNNQTATITVGQEVPFIRNTRTTETGQTINTIEYEDIGIILEVTPYINPQGLVIMDVIPEISTTTSETVPISETVDAAVFAKRSSQSRVAVKDGQTIVIGGLMQDKEIESVESVPFVSDIPIVGEIFKRTTKSTEKTELLIFLTPQVATNDLDLDNISDHERIKSKILQEMEDGSDLMKHVDNMESVYEK